MEKEKISMELTPEREKELQKVVNDLEEMVTATISTVPHIKNIEVMAMLGTLVLDILENLSKKTKQSFHDIVVHFIVGLGEVH